MKYSELFGKTLKTISADAQEQSHKYLLKGGFVDQLSAGIYSYLPLGYRVYKKIENIIREEMNRIDGQELFLPTLQPKALWLETDRWDKIEPPLFKLQDQHKKDLALGPTHEEVITDLVRRRVESYKDLPIYLYQIQNKFRNEIRSTGGLLRVREFMMKDLYSFHTSEEDLLKYFYKVIEAYKRIFQRCGLKVAVCQASGGTIGGRETFEFHVIAKAGEDKIVYCPKCSWGANAEVNKEENCPKCAAKLETSSAIEAGHVFALGTKYSEAMNLQFTDTDGKRKFVWMGCYGIGLGRLLATIVEANNDDKGIIWPKSVAPFQVHLVDLSSKFKVQSSKLDANIIYEKFLNSGIEVLFDDRDEVTAGEKFKDADLIGIPVRLVVSQKTGDKVEYKERGSEQIEILSVEQAVDKLTSN